MYNYVDISSNFEEQKERNSIKDIYLILTITQSLYLPNPSDPGPNFSVRN